MTSVSAHRMIQSISPPILVALQARAKPAIVCALKCHHIRAARMSARMPVSGGPYTAPRPEALRSLRRPMPGPQAKAVPYLSELSFVDRKQVALHDPVDCRLEALTLVVRKRPRASNRLAGSDDRLRAAQTEARGPRRVSIGRTKTSCLPLRCPARFRGR
jgi:hypothetical protein